MTKRYFGSTGFGGGHEQAVIAVLQGQYDAGVTWSSMMGDASEGYTRGNLRRMVDNGLLDMNDLNIVLAIQPDPERSDRDAQTTCRKRRANWRSISCWA